MYSHFSIVRGSISPTLQDTLQAADGSAQDLTGATVVLRLRHRASGETIDFAMSVADAAAGQIELDWQPGDTDITPGVWIGQYRVDYGGGSVEIWPSPSETDECPGAWGLWGLVFEICPALAAPA